MPDLTQILFRHVAQSTLSPGEQTALVNALHEAYSTGYGTGYHQALEASLTA